MDVRDSEYKGKLRENADFAIERLGVQLTVEAKGGQGEFEEQKHPSVTLEVSDLLTKPDALDQVAKLLAGRVAKKVIVGITWLRYLDEEMDEVFSGSTRIYTMKGGTKDFDLPEALKLLKHAILKG